MSTAAFKSQHFKVSNTLDNTSNKPCHMLYDLGIISQHQTGTQTGYTCSTLFVLLKYGELFMDNLAEHENVISFELIWTGIWVKGYLKIFIPDLI